MKKNHKLPLLPDVDKTGLYKGPQRAETLGLVLHVVTALGKANVPFMTCFAFYSAAKLWGMPAHVLNQQRLRGRPVA